MSNNFRIEEINKKRVEWIVISKCYGGSSVEWAFDSEEEAKSFIDSWTDVTLTEEDPYRIGTEWWYFDTYEKSIIKIEILDIEVIRWNSEPYRYFSSVLKCGIVGTEDFFYLDTDVVESGEVVEKKPSKERLLEILSKTLKSNYMDFIQL